MPKGHPFLQRAILIEEIAYASAAVSMLPMAKLTPAAPGVDHAVTTGLR